KKKVHRTTAPSAERREIRGPTGSPRSWVPLLRRERRFQPAYYTDSIAARTRDHLRTREDGGGRGVLTGSLGSPERAMPPASRAAGYVAAAEDPARVAAVPVC